MHDPVTWYKITYTGEQVAQWDFQNNAPAFVLEVPLLNLLTSICNFVQCDRVVHRAYSDHLVYTLSEQNSHLFIRLKVQHSSPLCHYSIFDRIF